MTVNNPVLSIQKGGVKTRRFIAMLVILAVVLAGGMSLAMADCKVSETGNGSAKNNEWLAKKRAKDDWRNKVGNLYGSHYQHWLHSSGKQLTCSRSGGVGNRTWTCAAISQPCLL